MYYFFLALLPVALGQIRADVRFGEDNERFDISPLVQEGAYEQWNNVVGVRRLNGESNGQAGDATNKFLNALRRFREDFRQNSDLNEDTARKSYDDNNTEKEKPSDERRKFSNYLHENQVKRRSAYKSNGQSGDATNKFLNALRRFREDFRQNSNLNEDTARKSYDDNDTDKEMPSDERRKFSNYLHENQVKRRSAYKSNGQSGDATNKFLNALRRFREDFRQNSNLNEDTARKSYDDNNTEKKEKPSDERRKFSNYLLERQVKRRSGDTQDDRLSLMHYGVPIMMKLKGIMQAPLSR